MYDHVYDELVQVKLATPYDEPMWQDSDGTFCPESSGLGCRVTHNFTKPEMCIVMDEVGGNTSQKGDGQIGGELLVCAKGMMPQKRIHTSDRHWTLLGLTLLNGDAVMCVVVFSGKREQANMETGMDVFVEQEGNVRNEDFVEKK